MGLKMLVILTCDGLIWVEVAFEVGGWDLDLGSFIVKTLGCDEGLRVSPGGIVTWFVNLSMEYVFTAFSLWLFWLTGAAALPLPRVGLEVVLTFFFPSLGW